MPPAAHLMGDLRIAPIGTPAVMYENDDAITLALITPASIARLFAPRPKDSNKGKYGHVLIVAGSRGKSGAAVMAGLAALRAGAGLVTVACPEAALEAIGAHSPELMMEPLPEQAGPAIDRIRRLAEPRTLVAIGPGMGTEDETKEIVLSLFSGLDKPMVIDADGLNCLAGQT